MVSTILVSLLKNKYFQKAVIYLAANSAKKLSDYHRKNNEYYEKKYQELESERKRVYRDRVDALNKDRERYYELLLNAETQEEKEKYSNLYLETNAKLSLLINEAEKAIDDNEKENNINNDDIPGLVVFNMLLPGLGTIGYLKFKKSKKQNALKPINKN